MTLQETLARLNWGGEGYARYDGYGYMTGPETSAWNQLGFDASVFNSWMVQQFKEQQNLLNQTIIPQLTQMATNPQGFGKQGLAAMRSQLISTVGGQYSSQLKNMQQNFASQNMAGLGSGVQAALGANLAQGAAGQEAGGLNQIAIANAQAQMQQQMFGLSGLAGAEQALGQMPQSANLALDATQLEQQTAKGFYGQQSPTAGILGSLAGMAMNLAVPGLGTVMQGIGGALGNKTLGNIGTSMGGWGSYGSYGSGTAPWNTPTPGAIQVPMGGSMAGTPIAPMPAPLPINLAGYGGPMPTLG